MPVHDINMDHASVARRRPLHLIRQVSEIRREYRGCKFDQSRVQDIGSESVKILARGSFVWSGHSCPLAYSGLAVRADKSVRSTQLGAVRRDQALDFESRISSDAASAFRTLSTPSAIANFSFSIPSPVTAEIG